MDQKNKIYVGNLPFTIDDAQLKELFSKFGEVEEAIVIKNKFNGRSKGFGFVTFKEEATVEKAISEMNQSEVMGRKLVVNSARPKQEDGATTDFRKTQEPISQPEPIEPVVEEEKEVEPEQEEEKEEVAEEEKEPETTE